MKRPVVLLQHFRKARLLLYFQLPWCKLECRDVHLSCFVKLQLLDSCKPQLSFKLKLLLMLLLPRHQKLWSQMPLKFKKNPKYEGSSFSNKPLLFSLIYPMSYGKTIYGKTVLVTLKMLDWSWTPRNARALVGPGCSLNPCVSAGSGVKQPHHPVLSWPFCFSEYIWYILYIYIYTCVVTP